jgi:hypothetical protein
MRFRNLLVSMILVAVNAYSQTTDQVVEKC